MQEDPTGVDNNSIFDAFKSPRIDHHTNFVSSPLACSPVIGVPVTATFSDAFWHNYNNQATQEATLGRLFVQNSNSDISVDESDKEALTQVQQNNMPLRPNNRAGLQINRPKSGRKSSERWSDKSDSESDDNDDDDPTHKSSSRKQNKGLKLLSVVVKDIVISKKWTTYKEVAEIILRDSMEGQFGGPHSQVGVTREEQNIKRRVYDALNVLISAGVLIKEGKRVRKNASSKLIKLNQLQAQIVG